MVESGKAFSVPSADFPTTNCPPQATAVAVAMAAPRAVVRVRIGRFNEPVDARISRLPSFLGYAEAYSESEFGCAQRLPCPFVHRRGRCFALATGTVKRHGDG